MDKEKPTEETPTDATEKILSRRGITGTVAGMIAAATLAACAPRGSGSADEEDDEDDLGRVGQALSGSGIVKYADTMTELGAITGGSVGWVAVMLGYNARGDGGGGVSTGTARAPPTTPAPF